MTFALAASVAAFALVFWFQAPGIVDRALADKSVAPGQQASVPLADGSTAYLDGDTAIDVDFNGDARRVNLVRGRAWFDVQHDSSRPFFVRAGDVDVRVVGTAFAVERRGSAVVVTVERGKVAVADKKLGTAAQLSPGQQLVLDGETIRGAENVSAETSLAWRRGLVVFDQASLATVADELSRMGAGRIVIPDESLRSLTVSGVFQSGDWHAVLDSLRSGLNLQATRVPGVVTVLHR
ncbi:FecR family protein [Steroidobacter flavus]|uniref:FecR family protein n=1 Tax=Steroidobacter flavus TaxID=1842136 RepID=A0ABV8T484_9GAMM